MTNSLLRTETRPTPQEQYDEYLAHLQRLLNDIVCDSFPKALYNLRNKVGAFVKKHPEFKKRAVEDFKL